MDIYIRKLLKGGLVVAFVALLTVATQAQNGLNSPYSQYGIGLNNTPYNMPAAAALGGVVYTRAANNMLNPFNPASYAVIGKETLVFDMGLNIDVTTLRNNNDKLRDGDGNLGYLAIGFPLTRWWKMALGVMPLSDVNYQSVQTVSGEPYLTNKTLYEGTGGVSQFFWGNGFNLLGGNDPSKAQLRAGFNLNLLYGTLTRAITYQFPGNDSTYYMNERKQKDTYITNLLLELGLQYEQPLGDKYRLGAGLTVKPHRTMNVTDNALVYTYVSHSAVEYMRDTIFPTSGNSEFESTLEQPLSIGLGLSLQRNDLWLVAVDATLAPWSGLKYTENSSYSLFGASPLRYGNTTQLAFGVQLLGDKNATHYMRRVTYSAGFNYESGKLQLDLGGTSHRLGQWGVGCGLALPMRKGRSVLNLSLAYSQFGDIDLLRRDVFSFGISIGSCESWFVKRKFN